MNAEKDTRGSGLVLAADSALFSSVLALAGPAAVLGPVLAWWLNKRKLDSTAIVGFLLGTLATGVAIGSIVALLVYVAPLLIPASVSEFTVPIVTLSIIGALFAAAIVVIDVAAFKDMMPGRRTELRLDMLRIAATLAILSMMVSIFLTTRANPNSEVGDAAVFSLMGASYGAITSAVAGWWVRTAGAKVAAGATSKIPTE